MSPRSKGALQLALVAVIVVFVIGLTASTDRLWAAPIILGGVALGVAFSRRRTSVSSGPQSH